MIPTCPHCGNANPDTIQDNGGQGVDLTLLCPATPNTTTQTRTSSLSAACSGARSMSRPMLWKSRPPKAWLWTPGAAAQ